MSNAAFLGKGVLETVVTHRVLRSARTLLTLLLLPLLLLPVWLLPLQIQ
jgi:hypothetical protein